MSRKTELAKNTAILTVGKLCTQCISFFLLPLYTAILSTEEYGTFDLLVTYSALLLPLVNWQLDQGLFRFMLDYRGNKEEESKLLSTLLFSSMMQSVVYFGMYLIITPKLHIENAYFLLLYVILQVFTALFLQFVRGLGESVKYTVASFISATTTMISSSIFCRPTTLETNRQIAIAAIGIITELVRKSKKSRNCMPMMVTPASGP